VLFTLTKEEKAFIWAAIQIKSDAEKEESKKIKGKKPRKR
jgi:hypothetical protein